MLGMKAAAKENLNLWGTKSPTAKLITDVMTRLSKEGSVVYPKDDKVDIRILRAKYMIYRDMADTQTRYRKQIDDALSKNG
jgi:hypothetical protein